MGDWIKRGAGECKVDGNFKWVLGIFGAGFMALLVAFASGYLALSAQIADVHRGVQEIAVAVAALKDRADQQIDRRRPAARATAA
jgi:hypothetical protein